uniref:histone-lysine N-methyltransferase, H3 lysine-79 specific-like n=1 Tax=Scatophagus argus TaxID=75038 RepID=UPI001ED7FA9F|nr:histone-lysine N-methyltransferase, H3 lysine-79 specific-like [Scatophagus argus]
MESSAEASQTAGISKPKPSLGPKPRLAPKPFSLQKNTTIRSIHAPKTVTATSKTTTTQQSGKSEATGLPKPTLPTPAEPPTVSNSKPSSVSVLTRDQPETTNEIDASQHGEDTTDSKKSDPAPQTAPPKEMPKSVLIQNDDIVQTNHKASTHVVTDSEHKDGKKKEDDTSVVQKLEESDNDVSSATDQTYRLSSTRKRLSVELTSKFESGGLPLPPQASNTISTTSTKDDANKPVSSDPEQSQTTSEPSNRASDEGGENEDYSGGGSIKRRISLLFDSSSRTDVPAKREEPEIINVTGGVKARIKNWATETSSEGPKTEKKPQVVPRTRTKSFESATFPPAEKTTKLPPAEPPAPETLSSKAADLPPKVSPAEQPTEIPVESSQDAHESPESPRDASRELMQNESTEGNVQLCLRSHSATDEGDAAASESAQHAPKRGNVKRRSVRFGVVERDDGGPTVILGSESSEEEDKEGDAPEDEAEEEVSVPVYRRVGILQKKDDEVQRQEEERLKHLEFEMKRRAEEKVRVRLEEERKQTEEEEREKEKARQREEERERERLKEEERERERLKEEERERERLRAEEREKERLRSQPAYSPLAKRYKPTENQMEVVFEDFSVKKPLIDVNFDDFSVKPKRWGSQAKTETSPVIQIEAADPEDKEEVEVLVQLDVSPLENKVPEQVENPDSLEPTLLQERKEAEKQLISFEVEEEEKEMERKKDEVETKEEEVEEDDDEVNTP